MQPVFPEEETLFYLPYASLSSSPVNKAAAASQNPGNYSTQSPQPKHPQHQQRQNRDRELVLPAVYITSQKDLLRVSDALHSFLQDDLNVSRLNQIENHLWMAGLERPARPLHVQLTLGRQIFVTEQADLHLLWAGTRIYIKPLPDFVMCYSIWKEYICQERAIFEKACGFLLSYVWLIQREIDLRIAHEHGLISESVTWPVWVKFVNSVISQLDYKNGTNINVRYRRGELRLDRINWIYRFCSSTRSTTNMFRGYLFQYHDYGSFMQRNLSWLAGSTVYVAVALTAMQVGLATNELKDSSTFQRASYGFTIFSIIAPVIILCGVVTVTLVLFVFNFRFAVKPVKNFDASATNVQNC